MSKATEEAIEAVPLAYYCPDEQKTPKKPARRSRKRSLSSKMYLYQQNWNLTYKQRPSERSRWDPTFIHKELKIRCRSLLEVKRFEERGILPKTTSAKKFTRVEAYLARRREEQKRLCENMVKDAWDTLMHLHDDEESQSAGSEETRPADGN